MDYTDSARRIVARHRPALEEHDKICQRCGRPWPCDVELLAREVEITPVLVDLPKHRVPVHRTHAAHPDWFGLAGASPS
jgi:hypothetical protein